MKQSLIRSFALNWQLSEIHGWGLVGVYTCLYMQDHFTNPPLLLAEPAMGALRPHTAERIAPLIEGHRRVAEQIARAPDGELFLPNHDVLHALGGEMQPELAKQKVTGVRNIGVTAGDGMALPPDTIRRANEYDRVVIHSNYIRKILKHRGVERVAMAFQGIDPRDFHPAPRTGTFAGRFAIFSGGKLEFRKGQDIVLAAFRAFQQRHPEALLVTAWSNLWPLTALDMAESRIATVPPRVEDGRLGITEWAVANGVPPESFVDLGLLARQSMAAAMRECDMAVFPNRCEAATNLVAMEALACGIPVVLSANTGHLDLVAEDRCYALTRQDAVIDRDGTRIGWGESSVEELLEQMERVYQNREEAAAKAERGAQFMLTERTWDDFSRDFIAACAP